MTRAASLLVFALVWLAWMPAAAADYSFSVPRMVMTNVIQPDASVVIEYEIEFANDPYASSIDVVDIGLPHASYSIANMQAWLDGEPLTQIARSSYIEIGVEVQLGARAIRSGERGTFRFRATMPDMVYNDTTNDELASFRITPTWFDPSLVSGTTDLQIAVQLPPGVAPNDVLYQQRPFDEKAAYNDTALVGWRFEGTRLVGAHPVALSFPRAAMSRVVTVSKLELFARWFENNTPARVFAAIGALLILAIAFFRWSGGTGCSVFFFLAAAAGFACWVSARVQLAAIPIVVGVAGLMEWRLRRKRKKYLPPIVHVEGGGIKRGLTAPEAAVLLELPLAKVVTLVVFGLLKKGIVRQVGAEPLELECAPGFTTADRAERRAAAASRGVVIHAYEHVFLNVINAKGRAPVTDMDFSKATRRLIKRVAERMTGFDADETKAYYRKIVSRAWIMARAIGEIEQRDRHLDQHLEWLLLDDDWSDGFDAWAQSSPYQPSWIRAGASAGSGMGELGKAVADGGGTAHDAPSFGDVAASFAGWTENLTGKMASVISPAQLSVDAGEGKGVVNLSGADRVTGDVLSAFFSGSGSGGGGGGGGGCACACAGCACACACAGGGR